MNNSADGIIVEATELSRIYPTPASQVVVFEKLSMRIERGKLVGVIGPSGAGKSTLLHLLGGLDRPTSGTVLFNGTNIFQWSPPELAHFRNSHIGFVCQFHHLLPEFTVLENTMMPMMIRGEVGGDMKQAAVEILNRVGLGHRISHQVGEISGGEQQRVAIARSVVGRPQLLLADEPTGNLDSRTSFEIMAVFQKLNRESGITIVLVTHELDIAQFAKRMVVVKDGKIILDQPVRKRRDAAQELESTVLEMEETEKEVLS